MGSPQHSCWDHTNAPTLQPLPCCSLLWLHRLIPPAVPSAQKKLWMIKKTNMVYCEQQVFRTKTKYFPTGLQRIQKIITSKLPSVYYLLNKRNREKWIMETLIFIRILPLWGTNQSSLLLPEDLSLLMNIPVHPGITNCGSNMSQRNRGW